MYIVTSENIQNIQVAIRRLWHCLQQVLIFKTAVYVEVYKFKKDSNDKEIFYVKVHKF